MSLGKGSEDKPQENKQLTLPLIADGGDKSKDLWSTMEDKYLILYRDNINKQGIMVRKVFFGPNFIHDIVDYVSHIPGYAWCSFRFNDNIESETVFRKFICSLGVAVTRNGITKFEHFSIEKKLK